MKQAALTRCLVILAVISTFPFSGVEACSCIPATFGFYAQGETTLPRGAVGLLWASTAWQSERETVDFEIDRIIGNHVLPMAVETVVVQRESTAPVTIVLVSPRGGFEPGGSYVVRSLPTSRAGRSEAAFEQTVAVKVEEQEVALPDQLDIEVRRPRRQKRWVPAGALCTAREDRWVTEVKAKLPPRLERYRDHLLFQVAVNDRPIAPAATGLCERTPPGRSFSPIGTQQLVAPPTCKAPDSKKPSRITVTVSFPALDLNWEASQEVALPRC